MQINLENDSAGVYTISSYTPCSVTIHNVCYTDSLIVTPHKVIPHWGPVQHDDIRVEHIEPLLALNPSLLLLGTGSITHFLTGSWLKRIAEHNLGLEFMDTRAACRTFNILALENRSVVAALLLPCVSPSTCI